MYFKFIKFGYKLIKWYNIIWHVICGEKNYPWSSYYRVFYSSICLTAVRTLDQEDCSKLVRSSLLSLAWHQRPCKFCVCAKARRVGCSNSLVPGHLRKHYSPAPVLPHLHQSSLTCTSPPSPAPVLPHLHQSSLTCTSPPSPAPVLPHLHQSSLTCTSPPSPAPVLPHLHQSSLTCTSPPSPAPVLPHLHQSSLTCTSPPSPAPVLPHLHQSSLTCTSPPSPAPVLPHLHQSSLTCTSPPSPAPVLPHLPISTPPLQANQDLPAFEQVCQLNHPTLRFVPAKARPAFCKSSVISIERCNTLEF